MPAPPAVQQSIDFSCPPGPQQQTHSSSVRWPNDAADRQTDTRQFHRPCSVYYAIRVNNPTMTANGGGSVAEWMACWTQALKGPGLNRSRDAVG